MSGRQYLSIYFAFWTVYLEMSFRNWTVGKYYLVDGKISKGFFLSHRYRQVPSFGRDTIRRFARNVSELKKMAARDFEDILQVSDLIIRFLTITYITTIFLVCDPRLHWSLTPTP